MTPILNCVLFYENWGAFREMHFPPVTTSAVRVRFKMGNVGLDELEIFTGQNTTTEFLAQWIWSEMAAEIRAGKLGKHTLSGLLINLRESDVAWASYEAPLG